VLIGETGLHFDVGLDKSRQAGNTPSKDRAHNKPSITLPTKQFQKAFDNILTGLDRTLSHYTLWNYTIENNAQDGDGWNGENLSLFSRDEEDSTVTGRQQQDDSDKLDKGGRAIDQFCRPYPIATVGQPTRIVFDRHKRTFNLWTRTTSEDQGLIRANVKTEIYVPRYHFHGPEKCEVKTSDGSWEWDNEQQIVFWTYSNDQAVLDHWLEIRRTK
jgi:hypothetical protein